MARKTVEVRITSGTAETNRDFGKLYTVTEMSAMDSERWAADALRGLAASGVQLPDDIKSAGVMGVVSIGLRALGAVPADLLEDLMSRILATVTYFPDPARREISRGHGSAISAKLFPDDIEEVSTLMQLRMALLSVTTGFNLADALSLAAPRAPALN